MLYYTFYVTYTCAIPYFIFQEGLVDVWVELSEGSLLPLRELPPEHYGLRVRSLDPQVVAVAPSPRSSQPRVIAIGPGQGDLLQVRETCCK